MTEKEIWDTAYKRIFSHTASMTPSNSSERTTRITRSKKLQKVCIDQANAGID